MDPQSMQQGKQFKMTACGRSGDPKTRRAQRSTRSSGPCRSLPGPHPSLGRQARTTKTFALQQHQQCITTAVLLHRTSKPATRPSFLSLLPEHAQKQWHSLGNGIPARQCNCLARQHSQEGRHCFEACCNAVPSLPQITAKGCECVFEHASCNAVPSLPQITAMAVKCIPTQGWGLGLGLGLILRSMQRTCTRAAVAQVCVAGSPGFLVIPEWMERSQERTQPRLAGPFINWVAREASTHLVDTVNAPWYVALPVLISALDLYVTGRNCTCREGKVERGTQKTCS